MITRERTEGMRLSQKEETKAAIKLCKAALWESVLGGRPDHSTMLASEERRFERAGGDPMLLRRIENAETPEAAHLALAQAKASLGHPVQLAAKTGGPSAADGRRVSRVERATQALANKRPKREVDPGYVVTSASRSAAEHAFAMNGGKASEHAGLVGVDETKADAVLQTILAECGTLDHPQNADVRRTSPSASLSSNAEVRDVLIKLGLDPDLADIEDSDQHKRLRKKERVL